MTNIHIVHRAIRIHDNTSLIAQMKEQPDITVIFIFTPEQINPKKNKYFSNNSVQFMIESLKELATTIHDKGGKMLFFYGDVIKVLKSLHKLVPINSISFNYEYTPYGRKRSNDINLFAKSNNITVYEKEDYALYDILPGDTLKADKTPYLVYTPYMNHLTNDLKVRPIDRYNKFVFTNMKQYHDNKYYMDIKEIDKFYDVNININVNGGRSNSLKILKNMDKFKDYSKMRDQLVYNTTFLGASNHFGTVSIREVYNSMIEKLGKNATGLIRELIWRQFYMELTYHFPKILQGMVTKHKNLSLKEKYDDIKWSYNKSNFKKWCLGMTGHPIVDAAMRQMNTTGFMHNRARMITVSFCVKNQHIDWRWTEMYFATKLCDYDPMSNSGGHQWVAGCGSDAQPWFRIFNPWTQQKDYDPDCAYIKKWIPELETVPAKDIHKWNEPEIHEKYIKMGVQYFAPILDVSIERKKTIEIYTAALK
jgi:deoxyribodipyrimidine photo-lyase